MKNLIVLSIFSLTLLNASNTEFIKDGITYNVKDKEYVIRCIEGTKWIQFLEPLYGKGGIVYNPSGNPQQMLTKPLFNNISIPILCE